MIMFHSIFFLFFFSPLLKFNNPSSFRRFNLSMKRLREIINRENCKTGTWIDNSRIFFSTYAYRKISFNFSLSLFLFCFIIQPCIPLWFRLTHMTVDPGFKWRFVYITEISYKVSHTSTYASAYYSFLSFHHARRPTPFLLLPSPHHETKEWNWMVIFHSNKIKIARIPYDDSIGTIDVRSIFPYFPCFHPPPHPSPSFSFEFIYTYRSQR